MARHIERKSIIYFIISLAFALPGAAYALPVECYCVMFLREKMGIDIRGDAWKQVPNRLLRHAEIGDVLLFDYGGWGKDHAALIVGFEGWRVEGTAIVPTSIIIAESNYVRCKPGTRSIPWNDPTIRGVLSTE